MTQTHTKCFYMLSMMLLHDHLFVILYLYYLSKQCIQVRNCKRIYLIRLLWFDSFGSVTVSLVTVSHTKHGSLNPFRSALMVFSRQRLISPAPSSLLLTLIFRRCEYVNLSNHRLTSLPSAIWTTNSKSPSLGDATFIHSIASTKSWVISLPHRIYPFRLKLKTCPLLYKNHSILIYTIGDASEQHMSILSQAAALSVAPMMFYLILAKARTQTNKKHQHKLECHL